MVVSLPDPNKFDAADPISEAQPELKKLVESFNTIATDYNDGLLTGLDSAGQLDLTSTLRINSVSGNYHMAANIDTKGFSILNSAGNISVSDDINFPNNAGPATVSGDVLRVRGSGGIDLESGLIDCDIISNAQFVVPKNINPTANIASPRQGAIVFNSGTNKFQGYNGTAWVDLS